MGGANFGQGDSYESFNKKLCYIYMAKIIFMYIEYIRTPL